MNIDERAYYVAIGQSIFKLTSVLDIESRIKELREIVAYEGLFEHTDESGTVTLVKISAGTSIQIIKGETLKRGIETQQAMARQAQLMGAVGPGRRQ